MRIESKLAPLCEDPPPPGPSPEVGEQTFDPAAAVAQIPDWLRPDGNTVHILRWRTDEERQAAPPVSLIPPGHVVEFDRKLDRLDALHDGDGYERIRGNLDEWPEALVDHVLRATR